MLKPSFRWCTFLIAVLVLSPMLAHGAHWYVRTFGHDEPTSGTDWGSAFQTIQYAIGRASPGDTIWVAAGTYDASSALFPTANLATRLAIDKAVTVQSIAGPDATFLNGQLDSSNVYGLGPASIRGVYLANGAMLVGFTISNGYTLETGSVLSEYSGGGVCGESQAAFVSNCVIRNCSSGSVGGGAYNVTLIDCTLEDNRVLTGLRQGGGAYYCHVINSRLIRNVAGALLPMFYPGGGGAHTCQLEGCYVADNSTINAYGAGLSNCSEVYNCVIVSNHCDLISEFSDPLNSGDGGGAFGSTLRNCTVVGNSAKNRGGGVLTCTVINSIVVDNTILSGSGNYSLYSTFTNSCTSPLPPEGANNIDQDPRFKNLATGDFRLKASSPCINAGMHEPWMDTAKDYTLKNPRLFGPVDMGVYEFRPAGLSWMSVLLQ